jgi:hypothetical protein
MASCSEQNRTLPSGLLEWRFAPPRVVRQPDSTKKVVRLPGTIARRLDTVLAGMDDVLERWPVAVWAGFTVLLVLRAVAESAQKPLWYDELVTYYVTALPSLSAIWQALSHAADGTPPLFHIVSRASTGLLGDSEWALRLPALLGCWLTSVALYLFVRRRTSASCAWIAATCPWLTGAAYFVTEARSYGLALGCASCALVAWQAAHETTGRRRAMWVVLLAAFLGGAISFHYYATFILMPLVAGEFVRTVWRRRVDLAVWTALLVGMLPLVIYLPLIRAASGYVTYGARPGLRSMFAFYDRMIAQNVVGEFLLVLVALLVVHRILAERRGTLPTAITFLTSFSSITPGLAATRGAGERARAIRVNLPRGLTTDADERRVRIPIEERVAIAMFLLMPPCLVIVARYSNVPYFDRYVVWTVIGFSICLAWLARQLRESRALIVVAVVFLSLSAAHSLKPWVLGWSRPSIDAMIADAPPAVPIVITDVVEFLQAAHYADPSLRARLYYLADRDAAVRYTGQDESDAHILALRDWAPFRIDSYETFRATHERFLLYETSGMYAWMVPRLIDDGAHVQLLQRQGGALLYAVTTESTRSESP